MKKETLIQLMAKMISMKMMMTTKMKTTMKMSLTGSAKIDKPKTKIIQRNEVHFVICVGHRY